MKEIADILEHEMENAFQVKDRDSLKRCVNLLAENAVGKKEYVMETSGIRSEIKLLAESMDQGFIRMDKRFEQMDQRFDDLIHQMDKRFEQADQRFDDLINHMDKRFEQSDKRFDDLIHQSDKRFDHMDKRFNHMFTFMTIGVSLLTLVAVLFKFLV